MPKLPLPTSEQMRHSHVYKFSLSHVPRPPNAFILFRSDFLKKRVIPVTAEAKQYNLSRIAADCWRRMTDNEQQVWKQLARHKEMEHARMYPGYRYKPKKRDPVKKRYRAMTKEEELYHCASLRMTYVPEKAGPVLQLPRSNPARKRKPRTEPRIATTPRPSDTEEYVSLSRTALDSPVFMNPLLPPPLYPTVKRTIPAFETMLDPSDLEPSVFLDLLPHPGTDFEEEDEGLIEAIASTPSPTKPQVPLDVVAHIRDKYNISRQGAIFPTMVADIQAAQALYSPEPFFISDDAVKSTQILPHFVPLASESQVASSARHFAFQPNTNSAPACISSSDATFHTLSTKVEKLGTLPSTPSPQPFPIMLNMSTATSPKTLELCPPVFHIPPQSLDTLTLSFDKRSLEAFSASFGADDQVGLFGQRLDFGFDFNPAPTWLTDCTTSDIVHLEACSREV